MLKYICANLETVLPPTQVLWCMQKQKLSVYILSFTHISPFSYLALFVGKSNLCHYCYFALSGSKPAELVYLGQGSRLLGQTYIFLLLNF